MVYAFLSGWRDSWQTTVSTARRCAAPADAGPTNPPVDAWIWWRTYRLRSFHRDREAYASAVRRMAPAGKPALGRYLTADAGDVGNRVRSKPLSRQPNRPPIASHRRPGRRGSTLTIHHLVVCWREAASAPSLTTPPSRLHPHQSAETVPHIALSHGDS